MKHAGLLAALIGLSFNAAAASLTPVDLNGDQTLDAYLESTTHTYWYRTADDAGAMRFSAANQWAHSQTFAGQTEWRLPTLVELQSLYSSLGSNAGGMNTGSFLHVSQGQYWSSTASGVNIFGLDTRTGNVVSHVDNGAALYAWAVMSAPVPELPASLLLLLGLAVIPLSASRRA